MDTMATVDESEKAQQADRIKRFREASQLRGADQPPSPYIADLSTAFYRHADLPWRERQAKARAHALERLPVYLFPEEYLVGMVYHYGPDPKVDNPTDSA